MKEDYKMSDTWDYRVVRQTSEDGDEWLSVQEVYYDDETGKPMAHTTDLQADGDSIADLRKILQFMLGCLDKEIVDEVVPTDEPTEMEIEESENLQYIYESPDGGDTIYRRASGKTDREKIK